MPLDRTWYNTLVDDSGDNTTGTLWNKAAVDSLMDAVDVLVETVPGPRSDTGTVHNWAPGLFGDTFTQWNGAADLTVTGLAGGIAGRRWTFCNIGTKVASFPHQSGASAGGNLFYNSATSGATPVGPGGSATWIYHGSTWVLVAHEQGGWITPVFSGSSYGANAASGWTVDAGDVQTMRYRLSGRTVQLAYMIGPASIANSPTQLYLNNTAWGGFTPTTNMVMPVPYAFDGALSAALLQVFTGNVNLVLVKSSGAAWTNTTNGAYHQGIATFEVT